MQSSSQPPQMEDFKMILKLNKHLKQTNYNFHEGSIFCRAVWLDCIGVTLVYPNKLETECALNYNLTIGSTSACFALFFHACVLKEYFDTLGNSLSCQEFAENIYTILISAHTVISTQ